MAIALSPLQSTGTSGDVGSLGRVMEWDRLHGQRPLSHLSFVKVVGIYDFRVPDPSLDSPAEQCRGYP